MVAGHALILAKHDFQVFRRKATTGLLREPRTGDGDERRALPIPSRKAGKGVTVTVAVPCCPAVREFEGDMLETVTANDELHCELMVVEAAEEVEPACAESPE